VTGPGSARRDLVWFLGLFVLVALGAMLALVGGFLVPARIAGLWGVSVPIAVVGNLFAGWLGARILARPLGALAPGAAWILVVVLEGMNGPGGDLVIPGSLPAAPAVARVGLIFLLSGSVAAALPATGPWRRRR